MIIFETMKVFLLNIVFLLLAVGVFSQIDEIDNYEFLINESATGHYISNDFFYKWDTLYVRTSRNHPLNLADTQIICLRSPEYSKFQLPVRGKVISEFGWRGRRIHTGIDIKLNKGDSVFCSFDGIVRISRYLSGYGNTVVVRHFNGIETLYAHLSKRLVDVNDTVKAGQVIGLGGRTGRATTDHLHFEARFKEQPFNPRLIIDFDNYTFKNDTLLLTSETFKLDRKRSYNVKTFTHNGEKIHIVQKGDTLYSIARKHNITVEKLCAANNISENKILKIGEKIIIPQSF